MEPEKEEKPEVEVIEIERPLPVLALVLSVVFVIPWLPYILARLFGMPYMFIVPFTLPAIVLGAVALKRYWRDKRGRRMSIAAISVGIFGLAVPLLFSWVYFARSCGCRTVEPTEGLDKIKAGVYQYIALGAQREKGARGHPAKRDFPIANTGWTPSTPCCKSSASPKCPADEKVWQKKIWKDLNFVISDKHYFQFRYESSDGKTLTIEARGDLECDGVYSSYKMLGEIEDGLARFKGPIVENEIE